MSQDNDGGRNALAGFLFQTLGSASLAAEILERPTYNDGNIDVSFAVVELEGHGQDAEVVSTAQDGRRTRELVQFKYSGNPLQRYIEPAELKDILDKLGRSEKALPRIEECVVKFRLVTNRQLSVKSQELVAAGDGEYRSILKRFKCDLADTDRFHQTIHERARAFGVLPDEVQSAIERLVGAFFERAASISNRSITESELDEKLVGFTNPRRLTDPAIRNLLLDGVTAAKKRLAVPREALLPRGAELLSIVVDQFFE